MVELEIFLSPTSHRRGSTKTHSFLPAVSDAVQVESEYGWSRAYVPVTIPVSF